MISKYIALSVPFITLAGISLVWSALGIVPTFLGIVSFAASAITLGILAVSGPFGWFQMALSEPE